MPTCRSRRRLLALLTGALVGRFLLAYVILPGSGELGDIHWYSQWALAAASVGPSHFYAATNANYPPGYIYILCLLGAISKAIASRANLDDVHVATLLIKIPPMLLDIAAGALIYRLAQMASVGKTTSTKTPLTAAACYLFNPVVFYDSSIWGQTDAAGAFIMLLGVFALIRWPPEIAALMAILSLLIKPQYGVILIPIVGIVLFRRHVLPSKDLRTAQDRIRILTATGTGLIAFYLLVKPFGLGLHSFFELIADTARQYNLLSVNAFNPWALVGAGGYPPLIFAGIGHCAPDDVPLLDSLTGVEIGAAFLGAGFLIGAIRLLWRYNLQSILLVGAYLSLCFFILPTRVHERYVFPTLAFACVLIAGDRRWLWATVTLSIGSFINLHAVLSEIGSENIVRLPFGYLFRSPAMIATSISLQTITLLFSAWQLRRGSSDTDGPYEGEVHLQSNIANSAVKVGVDGPSSP